MPESAEKSTYSTFGKPVSAMEELDCANSEINPLQAPSFDCLHDSKIIISTGPLNFFLIFIPPAVYFYLYTEYALLTFILSLLALSALAERLGYVTEQLALYTNETIGGLLNATFGNATELIISLSALFKGLNRLIQLSLLGSILSNMLLVLGSAFLFGGLRFEKLFFHKITSQINSTLLIISTMAMLFPTILLATQEQSPAQELLLSRACSLILFVAYGALLYFQLVSHKKVYDNMGKESAKRMRRANRSGKVREGPYAAVATDDSDDEEGQHGIELVSASNKQDEAATAATTANGSGASETSGEEEEEEEACEISFTSCIIWLVVITLIIAVLSEAISDTIEKAAESAGISAIFISAIILPIVGNAAEHAGAILFAMKGKLDLSLGVAMGSSTQIALAVLPFLVLLSWALDLKLDLNFGAYESLTLFAATICVTFGIKDGVATWMTGLVLIASYLIIAIGFLAHKNESLSS